jgi:Uma2 family endonuclease
MRPQREKIGSAEPSGLRFAAVEAFLDWHERQEARYDLVGGRPVMHPGTNRGHERIALNILREIDRQLDHGRWDVNKSDFAVRIGTTDGQPIVRYPDIVVDRQTGSDADRVAVNPVLVVEVLSHSTEKFDRDVKPHEYGSIQSLLMYIVFNSKRSVAQVWRRDQNGAWPAKPRQIDSGEITISELNVVLKMDAVFQGGRVE